MIENIFHRSKKNNFVYDIGITTIAQILIMFCSFAINKIVCVNLSVADYAIYNIIRRTASVITYIMLLAMGIAVPKYLSAAKEEYNKEKFSLYLFVSIEIVFVMSALTSVVIIIYKVPMAQVIFSKNSYTYLNTIIPMSIYAIGSAFTTYVFSYYRAVGAFIKYSVSQLAVQLFMLISSFFLGCNLLAIIYIWGIGSCIYAFFSLGMFVKENWIADCFFNREKKSKVRKELLEYCLPRVPGEAILFAFNLVPVLIITNKYGLVDSSYFSAATSINSMITSLFGFVGVVLLPEVSKSIVNHKLKSVNKNISYLLILYIILSFVAIGFVELFPAFIVQILFQKEYENAIPMIRIVVLSVIPHAFYLLYRNPLDAISKVPYNTVCLTISLCVMVVSMLFSTSLLICEISYVLSYMVLGILCWVFWQWNFKKLVHTNSKESNE